MTGGFGEQLPSSSYCFVAAAAASGADAVAFVFAVGRLLRDSAEEVVDCRHICYSEGLSPRGLGEDEKRG